MIGSSEPDRSNMSPIYSDNSAPNQQHRIHHQRVEVRTDSDAAVFLSRGGLRPGARSCPSHTPRVSSNKNSWQIIEGASSPGSQIRPPSPGRNECHGRRHPSGSSPHASSAAIPFKPVVHVQPLSYRVFLNSKFQEHLLW